MNESIIIPRDGKLVALVTFNENAIDWNQEGEDEFFRHPQNPPFQVFRREGDIAIR